MIAATAKRGEMRTIRSILVATDLTEVSDPLVRAGAALAAVLGAELHLLHAFDLQPLPPYGGGPGELPTFPERMQQAERALREQVRRSVPSGAEVASLDVIMYAAHKAILDRATQVAADLIVIGPHRRRGAVDRFLGSTADRIVRAATVPILVMRGEFRLPLGRVVAPIDLSEPARAALDQALWWAGSLGRTPKGGATTEVDVVHVVPREAGPGGAAVDAARVDAELDREVAAAKERVKATRPVRIRPRILWGESPAREILDFAAEEGADLVVIGTHGHGAVARALIGSVASAVARESPCPVLLVPPAR